MNLQIRFAVYVLVLCLYINLVGPNWLILLGAFLTCHLMFCCVLRRRFKLLTYSKRYPNKESTKNWEILPFFFFYFASDFNRNTGAV